ncbi:A24 family peptidase C-terminal domain-containing protein [Thermoproteota archaeon]
MITIDNLNVLAFLLSIIVLLYAAYTDLKAREVPDKVWIIYFPLASILLIFRILLNPEFLIVSLVSIIIIFSISFSMLYVGLFGGADFKAFICLSIALPVNPLPLLSLLPSVNPIFPVSIFYNAYFFSVSMIIYSGFKNLNWKIKGKELFNNFPKTSFFMKIMALISGYKTEFKNLERKVYLYPIEKFSSDNGESYRRLRLFTNAEVDRDKLIDILKTHFKEIEKEDVWVSPATPLIFFILLALISNVIIGDIFLWLMFQIFPILF